MLNHDNGSGRGILNRRSFLQWGAATLATALFPRIGIAAISHPPPSEKKLSLFLPQTGESLDAAYWADGEYVQETLTQIDYILRDHRANEVRPIDPHLLDVLYEIAARLGGSSPFHIISGYRTPATNAFLRRNKKGVAKNSLHIQGKAVDFRLPGMRLTNVRRAALSLHAGGVGFYPRSMFVHVDVGPVRTWQGARS